MLFPLKALKPKDPLMPNQYQLKWNIICENYVQNKLTGIENYY